MSSSQCLVERIRAMYESMTTNERRLADVILASPGEVATHTASELAVLAGVSAATTTRFFRKLGFVSYDEARRSARHDPVLGSPLNLQQRGAELTESAQLVRAHLDNESQQLINTYMALDANELSAAVHTLARARKVGFIGYRHSQPVAALFYRQMKELRNDLQLLPTPGDTLAEWLADYGAEDVVVCIGLRRRVSQLGVAMSALQEQKVPMLYLSDVIAGAPARYATWVIRCHTDGMMMFDSNTAVVAIINLVNSMVGRELAAQGNPYLQKVERLHGLMDELE